MIQVPYISFAIDYFATTFLCHIYLALQAWVTDFYLFGVKRCHLCSGVRQKNFRPIDMHLALDMHEKQ